MWQDPDEERVRGGVLLASLRLVLRRRAGLAAAIAASPPASPPTRANSLGAKLVQLTMPGAADVYQGCELGGFALVTRTTGACVDYSRMVVPARGAGRRGRAGLPPDLDGEAAGDLAGAAGCGATPDWFTGGYAPVHATGPAAST